MPPPPRPRPSPPGPLLLAPVLLALACGAPYPRPPDTARVTVVDTLHGLAIADDYRWLEDQDGPETRAWIAEQNAYAELIVGETPLRDGIAARLRELMDVPGALFPRRAGDFEYFTFRRPGGEVAAIHRRPTPEEFYAAVRAEHPTRRQRAIVWMWGLEATTRELLEA